VTDARGTHLSARHRSCQQRISSRIAFVAALLTPD
jgi:hypothetical protein